MIFSVYHIQSSLLRNKVQYIFFITNNNSQEETNFTSFANTNFCLGICKNKKVVPHADNTYHTECKDGVHAYISGIYLDPAKFYINGTHDEICIDFTPSGYYDFFPFAPESFMYGDDLLQHAFGHTAQEVFEHVFKEQDIQVRGSMIESFLLQRMRQSSLQFLCSALSIIEMSKMGINVAQLAKSLQCTERKLHRHFTKQLDVSPKDYIRVVRFRKALRLLEGGKEKTAALAYDLDFADQSHLIREIKDFTGTTPGHISRSMQNIQKSVWIGVN
jgi:AraC-like DNA-binding protein